MGKEQREGTGALFRGKKKSPKAPDYYGDLKADKDIKQGDIIKLSGWDKSSQYGGFISLTINNWQPGDQPKQPTPAYPVDDEVPF